MKKNKIFLGIIALLVAAVLVVVVCMIVLDNAGRINQGTFRVNDVMLKSSLVVREEEEVDAETIKSLSEIKFDADQENTLSMLVASTVKPVRAYVDNVRVNNPKGLNIEIYNSDDSEIYSAQSNFSLSDVTIKEQDNQYLLEVKINNMNLITGASVPDSVNEVIYDGRLLSQLDVPLKDIKFSVMFNINIIDENNKQNVCKVKLNLPADDMIVNGISVLRLKNSDYVFSVK